MSLFAAAAFGGELQLSATMIAEVYLYTVTAMVMGIGFGAMLQTLRPRDRASRSSRRSRSAPSRRSTRSRRR